MWWQFVAAAYVAAGNTLPERPRLDDALTLSVWIELNGSKVPKTAVPAVCIDWVNELFTNYTAEVTQR